jgi:hypothetical protein
MTLYALEFVVTIYSEKELKRIIAKVEKKSATKKAINLNNDHGMLSNGKYLLEHLING